jgi:hypothetical protein
MITLRFHNSFFDAMWHMCEAIRCMDHYRVTLESFRLEGEVTMNWFESKMSFLRYVYSAFYLKM